jgi:hypothetical protein
MILGAVCISTSPRGRGRDSSPAKRGRGTMRSMVEGAEPVKRDRGGGKE